MTQTGCTKLLKLLNVYLLMVTFEYCEIYSIRCEVSNNDPLFDSIWNEKKHHLHSTSNLKILKNQEKKRSTKLLFIRALTTRRCDRQTTDRQTHLRGENCWMMTIVTPLDSLSVKLMAPNTNAPHLYKRISRNVTARLLSHSWIVVLVNLLSCENGQKVTFSARVNLSVNQSSLTLWSPLLLYGYSYKASCARPG